MEKKVGIIILNYNSFESTIECIKSIDYHNSASIKYIIVDNGSTRPGVVDKLVSWARSTYGPDFICVREGDRINPPLPYMTLLISSTNDGYANGNNKGLKLAYADNEIDYVLFLNNDILFVEDIISELVSSINQLKNVALVSPLLYKPDMKTIDYNCARRNHSNWEIIIPYLLLYRDFAGIISNQTMRRRIINEPDIPNSPVAIDLPSGSCMLSTKKLILQIRGFDPNTFLYFEENILYKKIHSLGLTNYIIPNLKCIHLGAMTTSKSNHPRILEYGLSSASYYLSNYSQLTFAQRIIWSLAKHLFKIKILIIKLIEKW